MAAWDQSSKRRKFLKQDYCFDLKHLVRIIEKVVQRTDELSEVEYRRSHPVCAIGQLVESVNSSWRWNKSQGFILTGMENGSILLIFLSSKTAFLMGKAYITRDGV